MKHSLSDEKLKNIRELRDKLAKNADTIQLDMQFFHAKTNVINKVINTIATEEDFECGSTCCAVGYAAHWGIGLSDENIDKYKDKNTGVFRYYDYSCDLFCSNEDKFEDHEFSLFEYLFAGIHNNNVYGLIERIDAVLNNDAKLAISALEFDTKHFFD